MLRVLKEQTQDLHQLAETHVRILDRDAKPDDYVRYLCAMHGFHAPMERLFAARAPEGFDPAARKKTPLIAADLAALGEPVPTAEAAMPAPETAAGVIGCAYVVEGSTLGGKYILAHLGPALAALRGRATAFLDGYGAVTGARWKAFAAIAEREPDVATAVAAARATFSALIDWISA